ncbi:hypothetical protein ACHAXS_000797, partial [Conticribra weissflogii]
ISDLCFLDKCVKCKKYQVPTSHDIVEKNLGYKCFTKIDIPMQYNTFKLSKESQEKCVIITSFGKYQYKCLSMDFKVPLNTLKKSWNMS